MRRGSSSKALRDDPLVRHVFRKFDTDNSGSIDAAELQSALTELGIECPSLEEAAAILQHYGAQGSGMLTLEQFSWFVGDVRSGLNSEARLPWNALDYASEFVLELAPIPVRQVRSYRGSSSVGVDVEYAFRSFDADKNHAIDENELRAALSSLGLAISLSGVQELLQKYHPGGSTLDLEQFNQLVVDMRQPPPDSSAAARKKSTSSACTTTRPSACTSSKGHVGNDQALRPQIGQGLRPQQR